MAAKTLVIASLRFNVYENHITSWESRLQFVTRCTRDICRSYHSNWGDPLLIITGPEYMFARKNYTLSEFNRNEFKQWNIAMAPTITPGAKRGEVTFSDSGHAMEEGLDKRRKVAYSQKEKDGIIKELKALSSDYPNALLVPGTILWREYLYFKKLRKLKSPVFNTAPIISNGEEVHLYNKKNPSDEIKADYRLRGTEYHDQDERYQFSPGVDTGLFDWRGIRFGVEVCADHSSGTLKKELGEGRKVDMHLMVSAGMEPMKDYNCAKAGGYMISNDGSKEASSQQVNYAEPATGLFTSRPKVASDNDWSVWTETIDV